MKVSFPGKALSRRIARKVRPPVQKTIAKYGAGSDEDRSHNLLIEGDNLQALVTLYRERGHVDLILTDPPYNTGGDWRYNDKWDEDPNDPGIGELVSADDRARHTKWMKFMYPRLLLMKQMLKPGGVLAICIDHRELFHLGQMLDEIFGEQNRLAIINWQKVASPKNHDHGVSTATEHVLVYARDEERVRTGRLPHSEKAASGFVRLASTGARWTGAQAEWRAPEMPPDCHGQPSPTDADRVVSRGSGTVGSSNPLTGTVS